MKNNEVYSIKHDVKIHNSSVIRKFATNDFFINLSQRYLNTQKLSINIQLLISQNLNNKSVTDLEYSKASQFIMRMLILKNFLNYLST